jgi:nucleotide-binding universal stress UspA family protein
MRTPRTILVPVDFAEASVAALDYAVDLAEGTGAKIYILHTYELPIAGLSEALVVETGELTSQIVDAAQKGLDDMMTPYEGRDVILTPLLERGDASEVIVRTGEALGADLVCIGTHGRRGIARALIGSVAESVVRRSSIPVLTVHAPGSAAA